MDNTQDDKLLVKDSNNDQPKTTIKVTDSVLPPGAPSIGEEPVGKEPVVLPAQETKPEIKDPVDTDSKQIKPDEKSDYSATSSVESPVAPVEDPPKPATTVKPKKSLMVILIIILALSLVGAAIYMYISKQGSKPASTTSNTQSTNQNTSPASTADVSKTEEDVNTAIKQADDASDLNDDLSDTSLQL